MDELIKSKALIADILGKINTINEGCEHANSRLQALNEAAGLSCSGQNGRPCSPTIPAVQDDKVQPKGQVAFTCFPLDIQSLLIGSLQHVGTACQLAQVWIPFVSWACIFQLASQVEAQMIPEL